jgi:hypothetical protein
MEKTFRVGIISKAVHIDYYEVTANSAEEALQKAKKGNVGQHLDSYTDIIEDGVDFEIVTD